MKRNKVLLGLFAGVLALIGTSASAQNKFYEMGPDNVGGQVSSLVLAQHDTLNTTVFAGATTGGLFVRSDNAQALYALYTSRGMDESLANNIDLWHYVPYVVNGKEDVLPISAMVQTPGPDYTMVIGTGSDRHPLGSTYGRMSVLGKGLFRFDPVTYTFTAIPNTKPQSANDAFAAVHAIDYVYRDSKIYLYVATAQGLYRWIIAQESDWNSAPVKVYNGNVDKLVIARQIKVAFFSDGGKLFKIGDATASTITPIDMTSTNSAFGHPKAHIKLAVAPSNPSYVYAMVIDTVGTMDAVYLTTNMQTWSKLSTATVRPFTTNTGSDCGAIVVDPGNHKHIYIAGSTIWNGTGFVDGGYYQWLKTSSSEFELNFGDYMSTVYSNSYFVHSGIQQIIPAYRNGMLTYFVATDGGVYMTPNFMYYENINRGLNNMQVNGVAVAADGTLISGMVDNASPVIESRMEHDGGVATTSWYHTDYTNTMLGNLNHSANVLFTGNGGQVAASRFQQLAPQKRRNIFVSASNGSYGRSYNDYLDYSNSQTWTVNTAFLSRTLRGGGPTVGQMLLWETDKDTYFKDSVRVYLDTLGYIIRNNDTVWLSLSGMNRAARIVRDANGRPTDTIPVGTGYQGSFRILSGDKTLILSRANSEYPFEYTFTAPQLARKQIVAKNPLQSRLFVIARDSNNAAKWGVYMSWRANDFTKVWNSDEQDNGMWDGLQLWANVFFTNTALSSQANFTPRTMAITEDGRYVFVAVQDRVNNRSFIVRVHGFENVDYTRPGNEVQGQFSCPKASRSSVLTVDTLEVSAGDVFIPRIISSMTVKGNRMVVTFEGYSDSYANVAIVNNITAANWAIVENAITGKSNIPAYCSMIEDSTSNIYVGTANGASVFNGTSWSDYANINGVPVTSIVQQKANQKVQHHLGHNGINPLNYVFAKTKWPRAIYFGTYGRGIFMDMKYVTDTVNEVSDPEDYNPVSIPTVRSTNMSSVSIFPNPVFGTANIDLTTAVAGNAQMRVYDLNGRCIIDRQLGYVEEGNSTFTLSTDNMNKGMYLVNVVIGGYTAATKMVVR